MKVCDIYIIEDIYIFAFVYGICEEWFEVFAIDLNVAVSSCHVVSVFVLEDHETKFFHICRYFIEFFCGCQKEIVSERFLPHLWLRNLRSPVACGL